jgi:hypothetical protein
MKYRIESGELRAPADANVVRELQTSLSLPPDFLRFLLQHDGGEGFAGDRYIILWRAAELAPLNQAYEVGALAPGLVLFGSNGGGEAYGFDTAMRVVEVPFVGMATESATPIAEQFDDLFPSRDAVAGEERTIDRRGGARDTEIFNVTPIILGGDPVAASNRTVLKREAHVQAVRYWNRIIADLRRRGPAGA